MTVTIPMSAELAIVFSLFVMGTLLSLAFYIIEPNSAWWGGIAAFYPLATFVGITLSGKVKFKK